MDSCMKSLIKYLSSNLKKIVVIAHFKPLRLYMPAPTLVKSAALRACQETHFIFWALTNLEALYSITHKCFPFLSAGHLPVHHQTAKRTGRHQEPPVQQIFLPAGGEELKLNTLVWGTVKTSFWWMSNISLFPQNLAWVKSYNICFELEDCNEIFIQLFKTLFSVIK